MREKGETLTLKSEEGGKGEKRRRCEKSETGEKWETGGCLGRDS